ncbi:response regulator transcription factor [Actinocrispum wychmicini]|uniref:Response regulator receiver domain-containing protein n=1 Tax=Actinocrispum wychmicini TaxID=1213861 RepID=A0A4R2JRI0_9PSEU|nr:response regulator transcription factor [Actinocrispum wychmicini]TCO62124.1 response regulator receiver domain-containing protein [Actinocrispum wychmicini]
MRIVVVDDILEIGHTVAQSLRGTAHDVHTLLTPRALAVALREQRFDLAFVDVDFSYESPETGLTALRHLAAHGVPSVIYSADSEDNRVLFLLAAFQFYRPLTLLSKRANADEIRELVDDFQRSGMTTVTDKEGDRYRSRDRPSLLDGLVRSPVDLTIWENLSTHVTRTEIAMASFVSPRTVDYFLAEHYDAMLAIQSLHSRAPIISVLPDGDGSKKHFLAPMHAFAVTHFRFFQDPEVRALVVERPVVRVSTEASRGVQRRRGRRR